MSTAIKKANVFSLTKDLVENEKNTEAKIMASKFNDETRTVTPGQLLWKKLGYFSEKNTETTETTNFDTQKISFLESSSICIVQAYLMIKKNKRMFYADYFILEQLTEALNATEDVSSYVWK